MYPSFSPDGNAIIFSDFAEEDNENSEIFSIKVEGSELTRLTDDPAINFFSKYSPDGDKILFSGEGDNGIQLYIMDSDGEMIAFRSNKMQSGELAYDIFVMSKDGSNQVNTTSQLKDTSEFNPS